MSFAYIQLKSSTNDCFQTLKIPMKKRNGNDFVLFNSRWWKVKHWNTFVDGKLRNARSYIGKFSTSEQFRIHMEEN